jgi:hypothetical protein
MAMSLQEMRDFVRIHADADPVDAPNATLDVYARIAYNDILSRTSWPHFSVEYTLNTIAGQSMYSFATFSQTNMDEITAVVDRTILGRRLVYMSQSDADVAFGQPVGAQSEVANAFTVVNDSLILYPTPSTTGKQYAVRGRRQPAVWPTNSDSVPDLPGQLHEAIAWYMLSSYFMSLEDPQMAGVYMNEYEGMVRRHTRNYAIREYKARPLVIGGQNYPQPDFTRWVRGQLEG